MDGLGSGRWKNRRRKTVESSCALDVNQLSKKAAFGPAGLVSAGGSSASAFSINVRAEAALAASCVAAYAVALGPRGKLSA
jgi:hypothetical protein